MAFNPEIMRQAIALSLENVDKGGGPFGAVIVKGNKIIATGVNRVTTTHDPTAHAEIVAIRRAAQKLKSFDLSGCVIYSSCEPCPMCLGAIYWAHLDALYYGNTKADAKSIGFDDSLIYEEMHIHPALRKIKTQQYLSDEAHKAFDKWVEKEDRVEY